MMWLISKIFSLFFSSNDLLLKLNQTSHERIYAEEIFDCNETVFKLNQESTKLIQKISWSESFVVPFGIGHFPFVLKHFYIEWDSLELSCNTHEYFLGGSGRISFNGMEDTSSYVDFGAVDGRTAHTLYLFTQVLYRDPMSMISTAQLVTISYFYYDFESVNQQSSQKK